MALRAHETLAVTTVTTPVTTVAQMDAFGAAYVLCSTTQATRFTVDGQTDPVVTNGGEIGSLLSTTNEGGLTHIILTKEEFIFSRWTAVGAAARVQFEFMSELKRLVY